LNSKLLCFILIKIPNSFPEKIYYTLKGATAMQIKKIFILVSSIRYEMEGAGLLVGKK
jgi:hypothetical protein